MARVDDIYKALLDEAPKAFGGAWDQVKAYLPAEARKLAVQLEDIAENVAAFELDSTTGYPPEMGKVLLRMQKRATENVLMAVTALTLLAVEETLNAVLTAARNVIGDLIDSVV